MPSWEDVRRIALSLPETAERVSGGREPTPDWRVRDRSFAWERPLRASDLAALGDAAPTGPILAAYVPDLGAKEALIADDPTVYFTTPHFDNYPIVLARLGEIAERELTELLVESWLHRAPVRLARQYLAGQDPESRGEER